MTATLIAEYGPKCKSGLAHGADVNSTPANPVIGTRSFSDRPLPSAHWAAPMCRGFIIGCLKHFPGHGDLTEGRHE